MAKCRSFRWAYFGLWLVRAWFAIYGMGYIHPDEHMQNGEVTAGSILGLHALTTWEWLPESPVRSVLPTFATTGLPLFILSLLSKLDTVHPSFVFRVERLAFLCLSSILDYSVLNLVSQPAARRLCLLLLASSYVTCTFQVRPFSNSIEAILVSLCLVLLRRIVDTRARSKVGGKNANSRTSHFACSVKRDLHFLAALAIVGVFTRPTFVAFALPIGYQTLLLSCQVTSSPIQAIALLLSPLCTATLTASVFIVADTYYFRGDFSELVVTPYNFVKYNLSTENLADHGIHPNWLHVGVNLPILLGPLLVWFAWGSVCNYMKPSAGRFQTFRTDILRQTLIQIIVCSLTLLSAQPHQEPRFLTPLVPLIMVLATTTKLPRPGSLFWTSWIIFNLALAVIFGILHQGGVVLSLFSLHSTLKNSVAGSSAHIVYWKTYMPPRHLLGVSWRDVSSRKASFTDLGGSSQNDLMAALSASHFKSTYLVTPVPMFLMLPQEISSCLTVEERIFPHLDLDHVPESTRSGWLDGLTLGIYTVERSCLGPGSM